MVHAHCTLGTKGCKHTFRICNKYCFPLQQCLHEGPLILYYTHVSCRFSICLFLSILITNIFRNILTWDFVHFAVFKTKFSTQPFWDRILPLRNSKKVKKDLLRRAQEEKLFSSSVPGRLEQLNKGADTEVKIFCFKFILNFGPQKKSKK